MKTRVDRDEEEAGRLADLLSKLVLLSQRSVRSIEQEMGVGSSGLRKVLNGSVRLQMGHVMMVLQALDMTPGQFFQCAYPRREPAHPLIRELRRAHGMPIPAEEPESPEFEAAVLRSVVRVLSRLVAGANLLDRFAGEPFLRAE